VFIKILVFAIVKPCIQNKMDDNEERAQGIQNFVAGLPD
jgi:hypothetical protein